MHPYATDSEERIRVPVMLAVVSIAAAFGLYKLLESIQVVFPWWLDTPSVMGFYPLFYFLFNSRMWRTSALRALGVVKVPDLSGKWKGYVTSSFDASASKLVAEATIAQTWTSILIIVRTQTSESRSSIATISAIDPNERRVSYEYVNEPRAGATASMQTHRGFANLTLSSDNCVLDGDYYTGRGRTTYGSLHLQKDSTDRVSGRETESQGTLKGAEDVKLVELYTTAGVYYATVLIAVAFGQFSILTLFLGKLHVVGKTIPEVLISFLVEFAAPPAFLLLLVYGGVVFAGLYFGANFVKFSRLLDNVILSSHDPTVQRMASEIGRSRWRSALAKYGKVVLSFYVLMSILILFVAVAL